MNHRRRKLKRRLQFQASASLAPAIMQLSFCCLHKLAAVFIRLLAARILNKLTL